MRVLKKSIKLLSALVLAIALSACCGCSMFTGFDTIKTASVKNYEGTAISSRTYDKTSAEKLAASEAVELYFDKSSGGISFNSLYTGKSWTSLPIFENSFAASFIVSVFYENAIHYLDTSSCSADKNGVSSVKTEDGAVITYKLTSGDISLVLPVEISISGSVVSVECDMSTCELSAGAKILSVQFLPYLGAVRYNAGTNDYAVFGDWYLIPDGAGALMHTAIEDSNKALTFSVYGKEYYEKNMPASVGAYGVNLSGASFSATVCDGDENSLIRVFRSGADSRNINRIYPEFIITPVNGAAGNLKAGKSYNGKISVTYEFLSEKESSYTDVATSVRQALVRAGLMTAEKCESVYPLTVSFVAGTDGSRKNTTATFGQAENLLTMLKGKGVNDIDMVLLGAFGDGLENSFSDKIRLNSNVGTEKELEELLSYAKAQSLDVYAGSALITGKSISGAVRGLSGSIKTVENINPLSPYIGDESYEMKYLSSDAIEDGTNNLLALLGKYDFSGVCITDTSSSVYENAASDEGLYTGYESALQSNLSSVSAATGLVVSASNVNLIKYADRLYNVNFDTAAENSSSYVAVPFIPAILHGSVIYSGRAVNTDAVSRIAMLKAVEYGGVPHYLWVSDDRSDKHYDFTVNEAAEFMADADEKLSDLSSKRITEHFMYENGVYCTGYEGGVRVYVNYNNYSVIIGEVSVMPYNFLRIG